MHSRARRRFSRGLKRKPMALIKKLRKAKKEAPPNEKPAIVKSHLRNMIVVPEMVGSIIGVYNGKTFNQVIISDVHYVPFDKLKMMRRWRDWYSSANCKGNCIFQLPERQLNCTQMIPADWFIINNVKFVIFDSDLCTNTNISFVSRLRSSLRWLDTTWENSRFPTNQLSTVDRVLVPPTVPDSSHSNKMCIVCNVWYSRSLKTCHFTLFLHWFSSYYLLVLCFL